MQNVLADLCLESEAATATALRLARAYDEPGERAFARLATAVAKFWVCKRATPHAAEALECLGGNGYVEESGLPRLLRESPLNGIWEGSGNVIALDVLRAIVREPESLDAFLGEVERARGEPLLDAWVARLRVELETAGEAGARRLVERLALALQASLLLRHAPAAVADAFVASRLGPDGHLAYGALPRGTAFAAIVDRNRPSIG
jgi:putative acyl-CoA dehydrogenase